MKKMKFITVAVLMLTIFANVEIQAFQSNDTQANVEISAQQGIGFTIAETFIDPVFAQAVATKIAGGDVNAVLTQAMVDSCVSLTITYKNVQDITGVEYLTALETLMVYDNVLTTLPVNIGNLVNLKTLHIYNNNIVSLPDSIGNLTNLQVFHASNNMLSTLPDSFGNLTSLQTIYLINNQLTALPDTFGNLVNLDTIRLTTNNLSTLPDSIGNLTKLRELRLYDNQIAYLPDTFGNLSSLTYLDLGLNQLTSLPSSFQSLSALKTLYMDNNLLADDYATVLNSLGLSLTVAYEAQRQLVLNTDPLISHIYSIKNAGDIYAISLPDLVVLNDGTPVSLGHSFILEDFVAYDIDGNATSVALSDYILNGVIIKDGSIYPVIRATGTGLFPNSSTHAVTADRIQLNFETTYYDLSFDLNGSVATAPATQSLLENQLASPVEIPVRDGFEFLGWYTSADGTGQLWDFAVQPMPNHNVVLYAMWQEANVSVNAAVRFVDQDGVELILPVNLSGNVGLEVPVIAENLIKLPDNSTYQYVSAVGVDLSPFGNQQLGMVTLLVDGQEIVISYERVYLAGNITVSFVSTTGDVLADDKVLQGDIDTDYITMPLDIAGYQLVSVEGNTSGTFTNAAQSVTYIYEADLPGTDLPGTDLPGTDIPGTDLPGTDVPDTDVPGAKLPSESELQPVDNENLPSTGGSGQVVVISAFLILGSLVILIKRNQYR